MPKTKNKKIKTGIGRKNKLNLNLSFYISKIFQMYLIKNERKK